jgi:enoyl-CoA hydratase
MQTLKLTIQNHIAKVSINRPEKVNALNALAWKEIETVFDDLDENPEVRVIIIEGGESKHFCAGIDLALLMSVSMDDTQCDGRRREKIRKSVLKLQAPINAIENCSKPVLAAIHGGCIGGGIDLICACDMRYCSNDAYFTIKEIDMGMVADLGTLQRLPKLIGDGLAREMAYTGRNVLGSEAEKIGIVNQSFDNKEIMMAEVMKIAAMIASKSPLSIRGTKHIMLHTRDHSVTDGLNYMATWNAAMLISADLKEAFEAKIIKRAPNYKN